MGLFNDMKDDMSRAMYATVQRKIELSKTITIEELNKIMEQHADELPQFKYSSFPIKRITTKRDKQLEMQLIITAKGNVIKVTPNMQEASFGNDNFTVRTVDIKNGFGFNAEFNRDDYINEFVKRLTGMVKEAGY